VLAALAAAAVLLGAAANSGDDQLSLAEAVLLGTVEGVTEYLPVSSTGHLAILEDTLGLTDTADGRAAADAYAIVIQLGAIAAVLGLYRNRLSSVIAGLRGHDPEGRRLAVSLAAAFVPAALAGVTLGQLIKDELFSTWPIVAAWIVGGLALLMGTRIWDSSGSSPLESLAIRSAGLIGLAQVFALWPGTSRSLVTILAGLAVGLTLAAAVEFSFLLGLLTLGAATGYQILTDGHLIIEAFGPINTAVGIAVAAVTAWWAVKWMVAYLQQRPLTVFGWYRILLGAGVATIALMTPLL
jgi:undecaprenyl-diphosphatase